jgi:hypothetical protein
MTKIPVVEVSPLGTRTDVVFIPVEDIDDFLGELSSDYNLGLGELSTELGSVKVKAKASVHVKAKASTQPKPKPAAKKSAPKSAAKKSLSKPVAKSAAKKSAKVAASIAFLAGKASTKTKATPKTKSKSVSKLATKVSLQATRAPNRSAHNLLSLAKKAATVLGKAKKATKPIAIKTTIKPGPVLKLKPSVAFKPVPRRESDCKTWYGRSSYEAQSFCGLRFAG